MQVMKQKAMEGDVAAAKLVLAYAVGRASEAVNPEKLTDAEMQLYLRQPALAEGVASAMSLPTP